MRLLILQQQPDAPAQLLGEWAHARGHELEAALVPGLTRWPDPDAYDALVALGSDASVHASRHEWIAAELEFLRTAHARQVPILGICFGGQALAAALGGSVQAASRLEIAWRTIATRRPDLITEGPWFRWHSDCYTPPRDANVLAEGEAFALGRSLGLQFHPEVDIQLAEEWLAGRDEDLTAKGLDLERVRAEIAAHGQHARDRAFDLFDRVAASWKLADQPVLR